MPISSTCQIQVNGGALPQDIAGLLTEAYVDDSQRLPDMFTLRFRDVGRTVVKKSGAAIGAEVTISVQTVEGQSPTLLMVGEVTAIEAEFDSAGTFTVIRGYDPAHRLFHGRSTAAYTQMTASDIVATVVNRAKLKVGRLQATKTVYEQVSQCGQTDWEFLEALAREEGMDLWVREGKVHLGLPEEASSAPAPGGPGRRVPLALRLGHELLRVRTVITSAQQVKEVEVRGWDVKTKKALTATEPAKTDTVDLPDVDATKLAGIFGNKTYVSTDVPFGVQAEVAGAARSLAKEVAGSFAAVEGVVLGNPELAANCAVTLAGLGEPFDGKYTVTSTRHRFDATSGYVTTFTVSGRNDRTMLGLAASGAAPAGPRGPVIGQVTDVKDPEKMGRVRVKMPWLDETYVSPWARTVHAGAGLDRGWLVMPEVGDEVLVDFELGDVRRPYVLGGLYNGVDKLPAKGPELVDGNSGAVNRRSMVSRLGHHIDLLDQKGQADGVTIQTADDKLMLTLDAAGTKITMHSDGTVLIEGSQGIVVDAATSNLDLKGGKITIAGQNGVDLSSSGGSVTVKAQTQLNLTGLTAKLEGSTQTEVKGGATCAISGALVRIN
ncbi:VgrG-related protein [Ornithinimicrobium sp. F0845]|uniref:VgrG-related protein n=1 Tax=Ornithinimicrobium sp. F0845 TaxID=2926412 RepID=UPI001FF4BB23|nr:VgrG-related protein [Ornithinimicrobium sp. F0845]MCK0113059.1 VgrG-related protein [Ornithinimicrobium sp. F0845]